MGLVPVTVVLAAIAALILFRRQQHLAKRAVALTIGIVTALYLAETLLAVTSVPAARWMGWLSGRGWDERSRAEVVRELRRDGIDAVPRVVPFAFVVRDGVGYGEGSPLFPLAGIPEACTVLCNETGRWIVYDADEHGFRNPPGLHRPGAAEVVLVGDSFVQGECVEDGADLAGWLRSAGYRVLSLGVSGDGPLLELATLVEYAAPLQPPIVVWSFYEGNDLSDLAHEKKSSVLRRYLDDATFSQDLPARRPEIGRRLRRYVENQLSQVTDSRRRSTAVVSWLRLSRLEGAVLGLDSARRRSAGVVHGSSPEGLDPLFGRVVGAAAHRVEGWGGRLVAVYLGRGGSGELPEASRRAVLDAFVAAGVTVVDFAARLRDRDSVRDLFPPGSRVHYDADGYRLLASDLAVVLEPSP